jgi:hypothetical protein
MSVICQCPSCKAKYQLGDQYAGHKIKCPKCGAPVSVPAGAPSAPSASKPVKQLVKSADSDVGDQEPALAQSDDDSLSFLAESSSAPRQTAARAAAGGPPRSDDSTSEDLLGRSGIGARTSKADRGHALKKKKKSAAGWRIAAVIGGVAAAAVIGAVVYVKMHGGSGPAVSDVKKPSAPAVDPNVPMLSFTFKWPASERSQATLTVNGDLKEVPASGDDFKIKLPKVPAPYHFVLDRKGYRSKDFSRRLTEDDDYLVGQWESDGPKGMVDWEQDFAAAKKAAADQHKNVLIVFDASDAAASKFRSSRFNESVASSSEFGEQANKDYVCVYIDNPEKEEAKAKVHDLAQNKKVTGDFGITVFPTVVVTDARGQPFGIMEDYAINGVSAFLPLLSKWEEDGKTLLDLLKRSKTSSDADLIGKTLDFLELNKLDRFYAPVVKTLTQRLPGGGEREVTEHEANLWMMRFAHAYISPDTAKNEVEDFDRWATKHSFKKHADIGATLHAVASLLLVRIGEKDAAKKSYDEASAFHSKSPHVRHMLAIAQRALTGKPGEQVPLPRGSGSGFCIAEGNYIMTNHHVIAEAKQIMVHLNGDEERYTAHLIADNADGDIAVLKIDLPQDKKLTPIPFAVKDVKIGDEVCAFGWPGLLSDNSGSTLTNGLVSGIDDRDGFLVTNCKIEHGNSGGPLCSVEGCCIAGMVSRKTGTVGALDIHESYGLAIPSSKLIQFIKDNKERFPSDFFRKIPHAASTSGATKLSDVVERVRPSAVYVENYQ